MLFPLAAALLLPLRSAASLPTSNTSPPLPLLIWHGLGDRHDADGLHSIGDLAVQVHPGTRVHYIRVAPDGAADQRASFFGNVSAQIDQVCDDVAAALAPQHASLAPIPHPHAPPPARVDALGFSQGGQFLRALVQRCPALRVRSLVTFGAQHNGITRFPACRPWDWLCRAATALVRDNIWSDAAQARVVPAQYFRPVRDDDDDDDDDNHRPRGPGPARAYRAHSAFLADANNERADAPPNPAYARRLAALDALALFVFANDSTVVPKESGWFADRDPSTGHLVPVRATPAYRADTLGLRSLDRRGALHLRSVEDAAHMELQEEQLRAVFAEFFGPERERERERGGGVVAQTVLTDAPEG